MNDAPGMADILDGWCHLAHYFYLVGRGLDRPTEISFPSSLPPPFSRSRLFTWIERYSRAMMIMMMIRPFMVLRYFSLLSLFLEIGLDASPFVLASFLFSLLYCN